MIKLSMSSLLIYSSSGTEVVNSNKGNGLSKYVNFLKILERIFCSREVYVSSICSKIFSQGSSLRTNENSFLIMARSSFLIFFCTT